MDNRILVVDDAMFMRKMIRRLLEEGGYGEVLEAEDGDQAIAAFRDLSPNLVLLDITMPGPSGMEVLEKMLRLKPEAKIIMCSAVGQDMMIQKALKAGAVNFIVKPFKKEEFCSVVERYLNQ